MQACHQQRSNTLRLTAELNTCRRSQYRYLFWNLAAVGRTNSDGRLSLVFWSTKDDSDFWYDNTLLGWKCWYGQCLLLFERALRFTVCIRAIKSLKAFIFLRRCGGPVTAIFAITCRDTFPSICIKTLNLAILTGDVRLTDNLLSISGRKLMFPVA